MLCCNFVALHKLTSKLAKEILETLAKEITTSSSLTPGGVDLLGKDFTVTTQGPGLQGYHPGTFQEILAHPELVLGLEISSIEIGG